MSESPCAEDLLVQSSHLQLHIPPFSFHGVFVDPDPASRLREVSAALLCFNDLHHVSFVVQYIVPCIRNANAPFVDYVFPCYLNRFFVVLTALSRYIFFQPVFREYSNFLLGKYGILLESLRYCKLYQFAMLILCVPQQNYLDLCYLVLMHIVRNDVFSHDFLACVPSFLSISTNPPLSSLQQPESYLQQIFQIQSWSYAYLFPRWWLPVSISV
jgi:hypothetical protein